MSREHGLSLIELLVVMLLLGILSVSLLVRQDDGLAMQRFNAASEVVGIFTAARLRAVQTECPVRIAVSTHLISADYVPGCAHNQGRLKDPLGNPLEIAFQEGQFSTQSALYTLTPAGRLSPAGDILNVILDGSLRVDLDTLAIH